jgi:hypothetical protein
MGRRRLNSSSNCGRAPGTSSPSWATSSALDDDGGLLVALTPAHG